LATKGLTAGSGVTLTSTATNVTISSTGGGGSVVGYSLMAVLSNEGVRQNVPSGGLVFADPAVFLTPQIGFTNPSTGQIQCPVSGQLLVDVNYIGSDVGPPTTTKRIALFKLGDTLPIVSTNGVLVYGNSSLPVYKLSVSVPALAGDIFYITAYSADNSNILIQATGFLITQTGTSSATFVLLA
jgi:hypothetical protein